MNRTSNVSSDDDLNNLNPNNNNKVIDIKKILNYNLENLLNETKHGKYDNVIKILEDIKVNEEIKADLSM